MSVKRSIRMKQRPRTRASKRAVRTNWWTRQTAIAVALVGALAVMFVILVRQSPRTSTTANRSENTIARSNQTGTTQPAAEMAALPVAPPAPSPATEPNADEKDTKVARVTIEGCLERVDDAYRLTDTSGTNAPTSRSWKSGFLKKRPATIEVRDEVKQVNLSRHVGRRVSVTGTLVDRQMHVRSLQRVAPSCGADHSKVSI